MSTGMAGMLLYVVGNELYMCMLWSQIISSEYFLFLVLDIHVDLHEVQVSWFAQAWNTP